LTDEPILQGTVTGQERPQAIANHFAFSGVFASGNLGFYYVGHLVG
jgi:hypothetical protein